MKIVLTKDVLSGGLFALIGIGTATIGQSYKIGTAARMGPGFFPVLLGLIVAGIGLAMLVKALRRPDLSTVVDTWEIRPLVFVLASILLFSALIDTLGVIVAAAALILCSRLGGREGSLAELAVMLVVLIAMSVGLFVYGLNIPLQVRPW